MENSKFEKIISRLSEMRYDFEIINHDSENFAIRVYYPESDYFTIITQSDDKREGYVCVEGIVQNFNEWLLKGV